MQKNGGIDIFILLPFTKVIKELNAEADGLPAFDKQHLDLGKVSVIGNIDTFSGLLMLFHHA